MLIPSELRKRFSRLVASVTVKDVLRDKEKRKRIREQLIRNEKNKLIDADVTKIHPQYIRQRKIEDMSFKLMSAYFTETKSRLNRKNKNNGTDNHAHE